MDLAKYIEHTNLNENATKEDIKRLCEEALKYGFYGVCVYPKFVKYAKSLVDDKCKVITVIGFPSGTTTTEEKVKEAKHAIIDDADELDMVINLDALIEDRDEKYVKKDIKSVVDAALHRPVKVIIEAGVLSDEEKRLAINWAIEAGASFIKTSTGKIPNKGATIEDIKLIKSIIAERKLGIKAAGGISDKYTALALIDAGATKIGASKSIEIIGG